MQNNLPQVFIGKVPYELRKANIAKLRLDQLVWPYGCPDFVGRVEDLSNKDHIIVNPTTKLLFLPISGVKCHVSLLITEPIAIHERYIKWLWFMRRHFHKVFHRDKALANKYENVVALHLADTILDQVESEQPIVKTKLVSLVASAKQDLIGHQLRHQLVERLPEATASVDVMGRGFLPFDKKEDSHLPYFYSVVIENVIEPYYFTEKLIDCLLCECVPIYWGCEEVAEYYDSNGIIFCNSLEELLNALDNVSEEDYHQRIEAIKFNKQQALKHCKPEKNMADYLLSEISTQ